MKNKKCYSINYRSYNTQPENYRNRTEVGSPNTHMCAMLHRENSANTPQS